MKNIFSKTKNYISTHKKTSIVIGVIIIFIGYWGYKKITSTAGIPTYTLGTVTRGTIVASITGSGQVSADRTLELKPQATGNIVYVGVQEGQSVRAGALIAQLDATMAQKNVRDAETNLASAQISYQKSLEPADALTVLQAENALTQAKADLVKAYNDSYNDVSDAFIDLPSIVSGLDTILHSTDASNSATGQQNSSYYGDNASQFESVANAGKAQKYKTDAETKYTLAKKAYDKNFSDYKEASRTSSTDTISALVNETHTTTELVADAVQSSQNLIQYYQDTITSGSRQPVAKSTTHLATLSGYSGKINSHVSTLLGIQNTIINDIQNVPEKQASLDKIKSGLGDLDRQAAELSLERSKNALQDAKDTYANYFVRAPFAGTVSKVSVRKGDPASSGTTVATLVANEQVVDIPLNEVDVSKVKVGNKVTFTFDAIPDLTLTGKVASIDAVGTVTQGVVNYTVTMSFDATDPRVKSGMSTTASIITEVHPDVLVISSSAVKSNANGSYVQTLPENEAGSVQSIQTKTTPTQIPVTTGISDDTSTEIIMGVTEGQRVITKTITATVAATSAAPSILGGANKSAVRPTGR